MKKVMMIAAIAAALVSCQSKGNQNNNTMDEGVMTVAGNDSSAVAVYEGILPAADGPGRRPLMPQSTVITSVVPFSAMFFNASSFRP